MLKPVHRSLRRLSYTARSTPWFVDSETLAPRGIPPHLTGGYTAPIHVNIPEPLKELHSQLAQSPYLETGTLLVCEPISVPSALPLPVTLPKGRRKRGGTYAGEGFLEPPGGIWKWVVMAQVKEGTEKRGGIESVVRVVRKTLLASGLALPPNSKRREHNGWAMVDAGDFAVHVLSSQARERFFGTYPTSTTYITPVHR